MNDDIWTTWIRSATSTTSSTIIQNEIWTLWNQAQATVTAMYPTIIHAQDRMIARGRVSPEERAREEAANQALLEHYEKEKAAKAEANRKAEVLLRSCLTQQQLDDLEKKKCFFLYSKGRKYRIDRGQHGNVKLLDDRDHVVESYCIQPTGRLPDADAMLAQKLLLESDPESFRKISNVTVGGRVLAGVMAPELPRLPRLPDIELQPLPRLAL